MNSSVRRIGRNKFLVTYVIKGRSYSMIVMPKRGPTPVIQVINDKEEDVTTDVVPYMGPRYDWHHDFIEFKTLFDSDELTFNMSSGNSVTTKNSKESIG